MAPYRFLSVYYCFYRASCYTVNLHHV